MSAIIYSEIVEDERSALAFICGKDRTVISGSYFESREWRSWLACRKPKGESWDLQRRTLAALQRQIGQLFMLQYQEQARILAAEPAFSPARRKRAQKALAELEPKAREHVAARDARTIKL